MFVFLSKTLDLLLSPLTWALLLALGGALLVTRRPRAAARSSLAAVVVLVIFSAEPVANVLFRFLESSAVRTYQPDAAYEVVIVLGGTLEGNGTDPLGEPELNAAGDRFLRGLELVRSGQARNILLSAGTLDPHSGLPTEAVVLARELERQGIPRERVAPEPRSGNTRENAVESARIIRDRGWSRLLLITSAFHMERSLGCFRAVGLEPDALPVDYRSFDPGKRSASWAPRAGALAQSTDALRELFGRVVYRLVGYAK